MRDAEDEAIVRTAKQAGGVILTKDANFPRPLDRFSPPPQMRWLTYGNTSNELLQQVLLPVLPAALELLAAGEPLVEFGNALP